MILPFSTHINGKPTYFVEKIQKGLRDILNAPIDPKIHYTSNYNFLVKDKNPPKIHTIREDKHDRWRVGNEIHFTINNRTKNSFQFAPVILVKSIQKITIGKSLNNGSLVMLMNGEYVTTKVIQQISKNDGFENYESFESFFGTQLNTGEAKNYKIIHWTDLKY